LLSGTTGGGGGVGTAAGGGAGEGSDGAVKGRSAFGFGSGFCRFGGSWTGCGSSIDLMLFSAW
jgi:hypothetical protein